MPNNELAVIIHRFQEAGKTFYLHKIDGGFTYINDNCKVIYMTDGLFLEGRIKTGHMCTSFADWMYIPYKSIVDVTRFI